MASLWTDMLPFILTPHRWQEELEGWRISLFIFSSPAYKLRWRKPSQTHCPKVFLPSKAKQLSLLGEKKKKKKISIYLCVYPQISNTIRLGTTTVLSVAAASSETRSKKHLVVRMSPLHNSLGLLSLLYFPKRHSGVSFRSLLWQEDILLIAVTSCQACFDTTAQSFSCRCLQCHCWKKHWKSCCMSTRTEELKFASLDPPKAVLANGKRMRNQHWGGRQVFCWSYTLWQWEQYRNTPT